MKVKELIQELQALDPDAEVILQKDQEGNGYEEIRGAQPIWYIKDQLSDDGVYDTKEEAEDEGDNPIKGVVIYP